MTDIIIDTNIPAELLSQYYGDEIQREGSFISKGFLNEQLVRRMNRIIKWVFSDDDEFPPGYVVCSTLAFVEIARKFDEISVNRFTIQQMAAFIEQPPEWFIISSIDGSLFKYLNYLPGGVILNGQEAPIEWADAIHMATALSRDEPWLLAVTDSRMQATMIFEGKII